MRAPVDSDDHVDSGREALGMPSRGSVVVLMRECARPVPSWRHYQIVRDGRVTLIEMRRAEIAGWRVRAVSTQGAECWGDMTANAIVAWKRGASANDDHAMISDAHELDTVLAMERVHAERAS